MTNKVWNNIEFTLTNLGDEVTFHKGPGTDSLTDRYCEFESDSLMKGIAIIPDKNCLLVSINGEEAKNARVLVADKGFIRTSSGFLTNWNTIKLRAVNATTKITFTAFVLG